MRKLIAVWGLVGIVFLVGRALWTLTPIAWNTMVAYDMTWWHWTLTIVWVLFNAYAEGYRGFHLKFAPRTVARAFYLVDNPSPLRVLLAPLFCMGLFGATRKVMVISWTVMSLVVLLVIWVKSLNEPWRGIIDAGVVAGLGLGMLSMLGYFVLGLMGREVKHDPCVPGN